VDVSHATLDDLSCIGSGWQGVSSKIVSELCRNRTSFDLEQEGTVRQGKGVREVHSGTAVSVRGTGKASRAEHCRTPGLC
jgi:hypothetical protein